MVYLFTVSEATEGNLLAVVVQSPRMTVARKIKVSILEFVTSKGLEVPLHVLAGYLILFMHQNFV